MKVITRKQAVENGLKKYFTGIPCMHGHLSERTTRSGSCRECQKIAKQKELIKINRIIEEKKKQRK